jgi:hypothetical protein
MSLSHSEKYIVLHNPISNEGHLDSWHVLFIKMLAEAGFKIIALTSDPAGINKKLHEHDYSGQRNIIVLGSKHDGLLQKTVRRLYGYAVGLFNMTLGRPKRRVTHIDPIIFCRQLNALFSLYPEQVGVVFSMYMDAYDPAPEAWQNFRLKIKVPLLGLCITPQKGSKEGYYALPNYHGTCFLDETWRDEYRQRFTNKKFECLPDITETLLPKGRSPLMAQVVLFAKGRKIVFMGGSIGKQKNLSCWHQVIEASDAGRWCFVQIGRINWENLTEEDTRSLHRQALNPLKNLFVHDQYINDEGVFNEIISQSTVIFAVYRDFNRSSNMLSKAAYFEKPILVSDEGIMGERVSHYKIGHCVNYSSVTDVLNALATIQNITDIKDNFSRYRKDFSASVVQARLTNFIVDDLKLIN